jgi:uncharacterized membrane protein
VSILDFGLDQPTQSKIENPKSKIEMSEQEFENWLSLLAGLLQLSPEQRKSISNELRSHLEERMEDLIDAGSSREEAIAVALEEFGDTAALAHHFTSNAHLKRRRLMRYTYGTIAAVTCAILVLATFWPQQDGQVMQNVVAQSEPTKSNENNSVEADQDIAVERHLNDPVTPEDLASMQEMMEIKLAKPYGPIECFDMPLRDVLDDFRVKTRLSVIIDPQLLGPEGAIDLDVPVNLSLSTGWITARSMLNDFIIKTYIGKDYGYIVRDGYLWVTSIENTTEVTVYNCRDLLTPEQLADPLQAPGGADAVSERTSGVSGFEGEGIAELPVELCALQFGGGKGVTHQPAQGAAAAEEQLIQVIANTVAPRTWNGPFGANISHEGGSDFLGSIDAINGLIVIKHTREVHKQVEQLLELLRKAKDEHGLGGATYSYPRWKPAPLVDNFGGQGGVGGGGGGFF